MCKTQTMIYFLKFLIIYVLLSSLSTADAEDFDDYYSEDYVKDDHNSNLSSRQINSHYQNIPENFIGSNLFGSGIFSKQCFSVEDVALLATRSKFEVLFFRRKFWFVSCVKLK